MSSVVVNFFGVEHTIQVGFQQEDSEYAPSLDIELLKRVLRESLIETNYSSSKRLNHRVLDGDEMDCLAYNAQKGCVECQELLLIFCGRLVHSQAKKSVSPNKGDSLWDYNDLFNSGCIGVIEALKSWRIFKGHFTNWATYGIIGKIAEEKRRLYSPILIKNEHLWKLALSLPYFMLQCKSELGRQVSLEELASWLNEGDYVKKKVSAQDLNNLNRIISIVPLDSTIDDEDDSEIKLSDMIFDNNAEQPDEAILKEENIKILHSLLDELPRKQSLVIKLYYELDKGTSDIPGLVTFTDVVAILRDRYPNENWSVKSCEESNRRGLENLKELARHRDVDLRELLANLR